MPIDDPVQWSEARSLFLELLELDPPARAAALDAIGEPAVRSLVTQMLAADARLDAGEPELVPAITQLEQLELADAQRMAGQRIGEYQIVRLLGRGGMGVVYLAEREQEGVRRQVALKLIRNGRFGAESLRRFLAERRLLARLRHPGIARLIDLGQIDGTPFYAMEYVDGSPLLQHCLEHRLGIAARLELVAQTCAALAHAHQALVVHRDVKPSNVLVDPHGRAHLLDFGIAKALDPADPGCLEDTSTQNRFLSPYSSAPEMLRGAPATTACDTYAVGALLYELLCGSPPLQFASPQWADIEAAIRDQEPLRPSERVARLAPADALAVARQRGFATANALRAQLRGDLDRIALHALAKDPAQRYRSVEALADDLQRHAHDLPIRAQAPALRYRLGKFIRRRRWPLALATLVLAAVGVVLALLWRHSLQLAIQRDLARTEQDRAEQISRFLVDTFSMADPTRTLGERITARQLLDQAMARLDDPQFKGHGSAAQARILLSMAQAYAGLGSYGPALAVSARALALSDEPSVQFVAHRLQADTLNQQGQFQQALAHAQAARALRDDESARATLAPILSNLERDQEAAALYRQNLQASAHGNPADHANASLQLARQLRRQRDYAGAKPLLETALSLQREHLPARHPALAETLSALASVERELGNHHRAIALSQESLTLQRSVYGEDHPAIGRALSALGNALAAAGDQRQAASILEQALANVLRFHGEDSAMAAMAHYNVGRIHLSGLDDPVRAEPHFRAALAASSTPGAAGNQLFFQLGLAASLNAQGQPQQVIDLLETLHARLTNGAGKPMALNTAYVTDALGEALRQQGQFARAAALLGDACEVFRQRLGAHDVSVGVCDAHRRAALAADRRIIVAPR